jgi:spermidine/putrescine transport system permease protein
VVGPQGELGGRRVTAPTLPSVDVPVASLDLEARRRAKERRFGLLLAAPGYVYLLMLFAVPLVMVTFYSFGSRDRFGQTQFDRLSLDAYGRLAEPIVRDILFRSLLLAIITTALCLLVAYPFAYFMATVSPRWRNIMIVLVMIPFWTNFLVRNYAWRVILGTDGPMSDFTSLVGLGETRVLFTQWAVVLGMVYGFLPFMILPLYASIDRLDGKLLEASRDLYATAWQSFRHVLLPLSMPGILGGSILTFVPSLGAYVTPEILGGAKTTLMGSYIVTQFQGARDWPLGSALSVVLILFMLLSTIVYFRKNAVTL